MFNEWYCVLLSVMWLVGIIRWNNIVFWRLAKQLNSGDDLGLGYRSIVIFFPEKNWKLISMEAICKWIDMLGLQRTGESGADKLCMCLCVCRASKWNVVSCELALLSFSSRIMSSDSCFVTTLETNLTMVISWPSATCRWRVLVVYYVTHTCKVNLLQRKILHHKIGWKHFWWPIG